VDVPALTTATAAFVAIWFVAAAANMWIGVSQAGYSLQEGTPNLPTNFLATGRGGCLGEVEISLSKREI
jgi:hypothetical protein